jgi:hypothetical protein
MVLWCLAHENEVGLNSPIDPNAFNDYCLLMTTLWLGRNWTIYHRIIHHEISCCLAQLEPCLVYIINIINFDRIVALKPLKFRKEALNDLRIKRQKTLNI